MLGEVLKLLHSSVTTQPHCSSEITVCFPPGGGGGQRFTSGGCTHTLETVIFLLVLSRYKVLYLVLKPL